MRSHPRRTPDFGTGHDFRAVKARFVELNRQRLARARADLRPRAREFLDLLPLLLHVNHPILPGYVDRETPAGLPEFSPDAPALRTARRLCRSFTYKRRAYRRYHILSLFMMGSTGTIAWSNQSDFDIWVCHDSQLDAEAVQRLRQKVAAIEAWARGRGVEASLFLVDPARFREGEHDPLSPEGSGSAQHDLLLEEFYRTSILLAGRCPLWWMVPPEEEANYEEFAATLKHRRHIHARDHIDLGGLNRVRAEEFYGATLWLLYKGIDAPYKSILKILLMEAYASDYPDCRLLGLQYKAKVYAGDVDIDELDPYLMMLQRVEAYLAARGEQQRLALARRSFYFKVNQKLSQQRAGHWRSELLQQRVNDWGWHHSQLVRLDRRDQWQLKAVLEERRILVQEFTNTYRFLSRFVRDNADSIAIQPDDLNVLGRKLYAVFERKAGKIELVCKGITPDLYETHVSIHELRSEDAQPYWMVFSGVVPIEEVSMVTPLKRGYSLIEVLAWCYFNKIINPRTVLGLYSQNSDLSEKELQLVIERMSKLFPDRILDDRPMEELRQAPEIVAAGSFINFGLDPFAVHTRRGETLTSNRTDALRYGGRFENLALTIDQVVITSWQEVMIHHYVGPEGLMQCLHDYIKGTPPGSGRTPVAINASCYSSYHGTSIARRIEKLFREVVRVFYTSGYAEGTCFVLGIEWEYFVLWLEGDELHYANPGELAELKQYLGLPRPGFRQIVFDSESPADHVLPLIYRHNIAGVVQCFYEIRGDEVTVHVLDERGCLSEQRKPFHDVVGLVRQYQEFFEAIAQRQSYLAQGTVDPVPAGEVVFYRIDRNAEGRRSVRQHAVNQYLKPAMYLRVQALVDRVEDKEVVSLYCEEREFSSLEYGAELYREAVRFVLGRRRSGEAYPIYITDLDLGSGLLAPGQPLPQTGQYLQHKSMLEARLLDALRSL